VCVKEVILIYTYKNTRKPRRHQPAISKHCPDACSTELQKADIYTHYTHTPGDAAVGLHSQAPIRRGQVWGRQQAAHYGPTLHFYEPRPAASWRKHEEKSNPVRNDGTFFLLFTPVHLVYHVCCVFVLLLCMRAQRCTFRHVCTARSLTQDIRNP
jgi:hypothetical protein